VLLSEYHGGILAAMDTMHPEFRLVDQRKATRCTSFVQLPIGNHEKLSDSVKLFDPVATLQLAFST